MNARSSFVAHTSMHRLSSGRPKYKLSLWGKTLKFFYNQVINDKPELILKLASSANNLNKPNQTCSACSVHLSLL